jgi:hypothetical protein
MHRSPDHLRLRLPNLARREGEETFTLAQTVGMEICDGFAVRCLRAE